MAWIIGDGFDLYGVSGDYAASGVWDAVVSGSLSTGGSGRFGTSKACTFGTAGQANALSKSSGSNDAGHHLVFAYNQNAAYPSAGSGRGLTFALMDGVSIQCSMTIDANTGALAFYTGNLTTLIGSFAAGIPFSSTAWTAIEVEIIIHNTAGSVAVRLNGNGANDYTLTNVNTRGGTTNNYANKLQIGVAPGSLTGAGAPKIDDFLWFSTSGAAPNTWVGDIRAETKMPSSAVSTGLAISPNTSSSPAAFSGSATTLMNSGQITSSSIITISAGGTVTAVQIQFTSTFTGHYKLAIYDGSTLTPTTLLAQTAEQTNGAIGVVTVNLITPIVVATGAKLFAAILADTGGSGLVLSGSAGVIITQTYASGFLSTIATTTTSGNHPNMLLAVTPDNYTAVSEALQDADTTFVYGATAGLNDLYGLSSLSGSPSVILAVQTRMASRKSDTGTRTAKIQAKSGATTSNGTTFTMGSGYTYVNKLDLTDPNTAAAWTTSGVNSLQIGPYIVS